jgi:hypothetical protein
VIDICYMCLYRIFSFFFAFLLFIHNSSH